MVSGGRELCPQGMQSQTLNQYLPSRSGVVLVGEERNQEVKFEPTIRATIVLRIGNI